MSIQSLAEAAKLIHNQIAQGIAEDIITVDPIYNYLPMIPYEGQAIVVNRENALGDAGFYAVGATITHRTPATFTQATFSATKVIGDAEMDGLVQAQSKSAGVDQRAVEISSKAKSVGRLIRQGIATGTGVSPQMNSLHSMIDSSQYTTASAGQALTFELLDELLDLVKAKDGQVDFIMMAGRTLRSLKTLYRTLGGAMPTDVLKLPDGTSRSVYKYEDIPVFKNEYLSVTETANGAALTGGALASIWAGCFDDGTRKVGLGLIHPASVEAGIQFEEVGIKDSEDTRVDRVKAYVNLASFNRRGLARLPSINN